MQDVGTCTSGDAVVAVAAIELERDESKATADRLQANVDDLGTVLDDMRRQKCVADRYHKKVLAQKAAASMADRAHIARLYRVVGGLKHRSLQAGEKITDLIEERAGLLAERDRFYCLYNAEARERYNAQCRVQRLESAAELATREAEERCWEAVRRARQEVLQSSTYVCGRLLLSPLTAPWSFVKTVVGLH